MSSDRAKLLAFFVAQRAALVQFLLRRVGSPAVAEDLAQDTWLRLATGAVPATVASPQGYVFRVAGNLALDRLRQDRSRSRVMAAHPPDDGVADVAPGAERGLAARQRLAMLMAAVEELPPRCREVFVLRRFEDLTQDEIARRLGISRNMVEKHLRRALEHCSRRLAETE